MTFPIEYIVVGISTETAFLLNRSKENDKENLKSSFLLQNRAEKVGHITSALLHSYDCCVIFPEVPISQESKS